MTWEPDYVTLAEAKAYERVGDAIDDVQLALWITAASRAIDGFCHRQFGQTAAAEARVYSTTYDRHIGCYVAEVDDLMDVVDLVVLDSSAVEVTDYALAQENALQKGQPYERILTSAAGPFTASTKWGWTAVPVPVKSATLLQIARFAARRDAPFGVAGSPTEGSEVRLLNKLDPDVEVMLPKKYRREWWAV